MILTENERPSPQDLNTPRGYLFYSSRVDLKLGTSGWKNLLLTTTPAGNEKDVKILPRRFGAG